MAQPQRGSAAKPRAAARKPSGDSAALPAECVTLQGLGTLLAYDRLLKDCADARSAQAERLLPLIHAAMAAGAEGKARLEDVSRTYAAKDNGGSAHVQLKSKSIKSLTVDKARLLNGLKIPLREVPARKVLNPLYAGAGAAEGDGAALVAGVVAKLEALVAANPGCGLPPDLFITVDSVAVPVEDALLRALRLPADTRGDALAILSDVAFLRGSLTSTDLLREVLGEQAAKLDGEMAGENGHLAPGGEVVDFAEVARSQKAAPSK